LYTFCCVVGLPYFILVSSIKTNDWKSYILSCKLFMRWCLTTHVETKKVQVNKRVKINGRWTKKRVTEIRKKNNGKPGYFKLFAVHLFDILYLFNNDIIKLLSQNFTFSSTENNISYDEWTEMENKKFKPKSKTNNADTKVMMLSEMYHIIHFICLINEDNTEYSKDKFNKEFQTDNDNPLLKLPTNASMASEIMKENREMKCLKEKIASILSQECHKYFFKFKK